MSSQVDINQWVGIEKILQVEIVADMGYHPWFFLLFRNHLNDIENIVPFVLIGGLYVAINPDPQAALNHFRTFFFSRLFHTIAYQVPLPQPSRALGFMLGMGVNVSMAVQVLVATW